MPQTQPEQDNEQEEHDAATAALFEACEVGDAVKVAALLEGNANPNSADHEVCESRLLFILYKPTPCFVCKPNALASNSERASNHSASTRMPTTTPLLNET